MEMAARLCAILHEKEIPFFLESPTNQQFVILGNDRIEQLRHDVAFSFWEALDEKRTVVRFAVSWSTTEADLNRLRELL